ncbi:hypothetical protein Ciccas_008556 [Cichlidogyrus casuarinus]|uniref:Uncharacterized protein n=1 Tax=Cichlidogyrus casuarinus TaxID=1844966 RepID=A0ABD2Q3V5_9PLAT
MLFSCCPCVGRKSKRHNQKKRNSYERKVGARLSEPSGAPVFVRPPSIYYLEDKTNPPEPRNRARRVNPPTKSQRRTLEEHLIRNAQPRGNPPFKSEPRTIEERLIRNPEQRGNPPIKSETRKPIQILEEHFIRNPEQRGNPPIKSETRKPIQILEEHLIRNPEPRVNHQQEPIKRERQFPDPELRKKNHESDKEEELEKRFCNVVTMTDTISHDAAMQTEEEMDFEPSDQFDWVSKMDACAQTEMADDLETLPIPTQDCRITVKDAEEIVARSLTELATLTPVEYREMQLMKNDAVSRHKCCFSKQANNENLNWRNILTGYEKWGEEEAVLALYRASPSMGRLLKRYAQL